MAANSSHPHHVANMEPLELPPTRQKEHCQLASTGTLPSYLSTSWLATLFFLGRGQPQHAICFPTRALSITAKPAALVGQWLLHMSCSSINIRVITLKQNAWFLWFSTSMAITSLKSLLQVFCKCAVSDSVFRSFYLNRASYLISIKSSCHSKNMLPRPSPIFTCLCKGNPHLFPLNMMG